MPEFQYQNSIKWYQMSSEARVKFITPKFILDIIPKASQTKFCQIRITKSKVIHVQVPVPNWEKWRSEKTFSGLQNGAIGDYKSGQEGLQIGARGITNRGRDYKSVQDTRKIEPWGTPVIMSVQLLKNPFIVVLWNHLYNWLCIILRDVNENPYASCKLWFIVSKVFERSFRITPTRSLLSRYFFQTSLIFKSKCWELWFFLKPYK